MTVVGAGGRLGDLLVAAGAIATKKEYSRLVLQKAVSIDDVVVDDVFQSAPVTEGVVVRVGKRRFYKTVRN